MEKVKQLADKARRLTMTVPEAAEVLGIGRAAAYEAARSGQLPIIRVGKRVLVPVAALERMLSAAGTRQTEAVQA
ncbi:MAG: DNA-binding protein [Hyphomicrobiales bacterium]|nr:MAG: DNA-binding protein [Hyphomicrobiales bacterium]